MPLTAIASFNTDITTRGFKGHEMIDAVGLVHMNGRVYEPELGRFLSADPIVEDIENLQTYNRYSYVRNNPLTLTDPDGFQSAGEGDAPRISVDTDNDNSATDGPSGSSLVSLMNHSRQSLANSNPAPTEEVNLSHFTNNTVNSSNEAIWSDGLIVDHDVQNFSYAAAYAPAISAPLVRFGLVNLVKVC